MNALNHPVRAHPWALPEYYHDRIIRQSRCIAYFRMDSIIICRGYPVGYK